jgi:FkbM family methyltransferase
MSFANGPRLLVDLASSSMPWRRDELRFVASDGTTIVCPNVAGARVPVYELFAEDAYRLGELADAVGLLPVVLDIGGQVGCFSVAFARRNPGATVHAYEASPSTAVWLGRNVADNGLADQVVVHAEAVSDHTGTLEFLDNGAASGLNGLTGTQGTTVSVPCVTFRDAVSSWAATRPTGRACAKW